MARTATQWVDWNATSFAICNKSRYEILTKTLENIKSLIYRIYYTLKQYVSIAFSTAAKTNTDALIVDYDTRFSLFSSGKKCVRHWSVRLKWLLLIFFFRWLSYNYKRPDRWALPVSIDLNYYILLFPTYIMFIVFSGLRNRDALQQMLQKKFYQN